MPLKHYKNIAHNLHTYKSHICVQGNCSYFYCHFLYRSLNLVLQIQKLSIILTKSDIFILDTHIYVLKNYLFKDTKPIKIYASIQWPIQSTKVGAKEWVSEIHMKIPISFQPNNPRPVSSGSKVLDKVSSVFTSSKYATLYLFEMHRNNNDSNNQ